MRLILPMHCRQSEVGELDGERLQRRDKYIASRDVTMNNIATVHVHECLGTLL